MSKDWVCFCQSRQATKKSLSNNLCLLVLNTKQLKLRVGVQNGTDVES